MSADATRWPRLRLETHPLLDWVETEYTKERLLEMAEAINKNPNPIRAFTASGKVHGVWDPAIEKVLRALVDNDVALKALNHRRPKPPARVVGLNRAAHFHVWVALNPGRQVKAAWAAVADAWGVTASQVKDDVAKYGVKDSGEYRTNDAVRIVKQIIHNASRMTGHSRAQVLSDFEVDLRDRGATMERRKK